MIKGSNAIEIKILTQFLFFVRVMNIKYLEMKRQFLTHTDFTQAFSRKMSNKKQFKHENDSLVRNIIYLQIRILKFTHQFPVRETVIAVKFDIVVFLVQVPSVVAIYLGVKQTTLLNE